MKVSDRLASIDTIGRKLQSTYTYDEIDAYLAAFKINPPNRDESHGSKWVYSKLALKNVSPETLEMIAEDLGIFVPVQTAKMVSPPRNWQQTRQFKLFVSHIAKDKDKATRIRDTLKPYAIDAFVAHEDIHPTADWQVEIERALFSMDAFLAIHTRGFSASSWTQQEVGFAYARRIKIISLKMGEDPTGFISKKQALPRLDRNAAEISKEIEKLLSDDISTSDALKKAQAK